MLIRHASNMLFMTSGVLHTQDGLDFQDLLEQHPDAVMEYIVNRGTKQLGTFKCKVPAAPRP